MKLIRPFLIVGIALLLIPRVVRAETEDTASVYFYEETLDGDFEGFEITVSLQEESPLDEKVTELFTILIDNEENYFTFVPEDTELLWAVVADKRLILNFSGEALEYGGTFQEGHFVEQIIKTAYSMEEISSIMIYIDGKEAQLPEGTDFSYYNR